MGFCYIVDMWIKEGWITPTDGVVEDYSSITEYIMKSAEKEGWLIKEVCIDLYNTTQFAQEIMDEGYLAVEIRQGWKMLPEPTKLRKAVYSFRCFCFKNMFS